MLLRFAVSVVVTSNIAAEAAATNGNGKPERAQEGRERNGGRRQKPQNTVIFSLSRSLRALNIFPIVEEFINRDGRRRSSRALWMGSQKTTNTKWRLSCAPKRPLESWGRLNQNQSRSFFFLSLNRDYEASRYDIRKFSDHIWN